MVANGPEFSTGADKDAVAEESRASPALAGQLEKDRKIRREIANSNERRRMQSINAGFQTLRSLLPAASLTCSTHSAATSEKLSKATILQQAASFIKTLEDDKRQLLERCEELQQQQQRVSSSNATASVRATASPQPHTAHQLPSRLPLVDVSAIAAAVTQQQQPAAGLKRRKRDTESSDEGIALAYTTSLSDEAMSPLPPPPQPPPSVVEEMRRELQELRAVLEAERQRCGTLEHCCAMLQERLQQVLQAPATASLPAAAGNVQSPHHSSAAGVMAFARDDRCSTVSRCIPAAAEVNADHDRSRAPLSSRNLQMIVEAIQHLEGGGGNFAEQCSPPATPRGSVAALAESETRDAAGGSRASEIRRTGQATLLRSASEPTPSAAVVPSCDGSDPAVEFAAAAAATAQPAVLRQQHGLFYRPTFMANVPTTIVEHMATSGGR